MNEPGVEQNNRGGGKKPQNLKLLDLNLFNPPIFLIKFLQKN